MNRNKISFRAALPEDFPHVHQLIREFAAFQKTPEKVSITPEAMLADKDIVQCLVVLNEQEEIVGFATFFFAYYSWSGKALYLDDLYIQQPYRNQQAGSRLLDEVLRYGRKAGCKKVRWLVSGWNSKAIAFYKRMGALIEEGELICELKL